MILQFVSYEVLDTSITMKFSNPLNTGEDYTISLSDAELAAISTQGQLRTAVINKLTRKIQRVGIASKLDQFIGQSVTI